MHLFVCRDGPCDWAECWGSLAAELPNFFDLLVVEFVPQSWSDQYVCTHTHTCTHTHIKVITGTDTHADTHTVPAHSCLQRYMVCALERIRKLLLGLGCEGMFSYVGQQMSCLGTRVVDELTV